MFQTNWTKVSKPKVSKPKVSKPLNKVPLAIPIAGVWTGKRENELGKDLTLTKEEGRRISSQTSRCASLTSATRCYLRLGGISASYELPSQCCRMLLKGREKTGLRSLKCHPELFLNISEMYRTWIPEFPCIPSTAPATQMYSKIPIRHFWR